MIITTTNIAALNPCEDRFNNFTNHYPNFNGSLVDFLNLDNITYLDKVWVFVRLATHIQNVKWSIMCAESVLHYYEDKYPNEKAPRKALEAAQVFVLEPNEKNRICIADAANASDAASYAATAKAVDAAYSADYTSYAAANAAYSAADAAYASDAPAAANAAYAAANAAYAAANAKEQQEELNLQFMVEACRE